MRQAALASAVTSAALAACTLSAPSAPLAELRNPQDIADELLATDRAFSDQAADGTIAAELPAMFDDRIILPLPNGTFAMSKAAASAALPTNPANVVSTGTWAPIRVGISADGMHGFTYGFMTIRAQGKPDARAKYLAYWIRRPQGWRVAAYKRTPSPPGEVQTALRPPSLPQRLVPPTSDPRIVQAHRASLAAAEKSFSDRAQEIGMGPAFTEFGATDAMNMGPGPDFVHGNVAIGSSGGFAPGEKAPVHWAADHATLVASSGDLGVTFGYIRPHAARPAGQPQASAFFTVWRRETPQSPWRYVAE